MTIFVIVIEIKHTKGGTNVHTITNRQNSRAKI